MIPTGQTFHAGHRATILRITKCEACGEPFHYPMTVTGTGRGYSPLWLNNAGAAKEARQEAANNLVHKMVHEVDIVPCPSCGWYQQAMVKKDRRQRLEDRIAPVALVSILLGFGFLMLLDRLGVINRGPSTLPMLFAVPVTTFFFGWCCVRARHLNHDHPGAGKVHAERAAASKADRKPAVKGADARQ